MIIIRPLPLAIVLACSGLAACDDAEKTKNEPKAADASPASAAEAPSHRINLNTALEADFKALPGVGDKMAHEFEEYRPYASITQFRKEMGKYVDAETVAGYERYVFVPVAFNDCDAATLQQIPGIDTGAAEKLIAARPYGDDVSFSTKVREVGGASAEAAAMELLAKDAT